MYWPDIGYVQGMSFIGGIVLMVTESVYYGFILFHNIITKSCLYNFYSFDENYMKTWQVIFKQIFGHNSKDLLFHLEEEKVNPSLYLIEWFMSLFARALNMDITCWVWDLILLDGQHILYKTATAIMMTLEEDLMNASDIEDIMHILQTAQDRITDEEEFVRCIFRVNIPDWIDKELERLENDYVLKNLKLS